MTSGDVFSSNFTTSSTVSLQPANDVMLTSILCSTNDGRIDINGANYAMQAEQTNGGSAPAGTQSLVKWTGGSLLNMKLFLTNSTFISLNSSSTGVRFMYSGIEL